MSWGSPMRTYRAVIAILCVALAVGVISLFMGFYTLWMGPTDCRVLKTGHSANQGVRNG